MNYNIQFEVNVPKNYVVSINARASFTYAENQWWIYQYNYYNSFQARFCHDLNRDKTETV